jgi:hypothetical protein
VTGGFDSRSGDFRDQADDGSCCHPRRNVVPLEAVVRGDVDLAPARDEEEAPGGARSEPVALLHS